MPRIRYFKKALNYEELFDNLNEQDDEGMPLESQQKGWWSSSSIISSIPTEKLQQLLRNYKEAILLLEQEYLSRLSINSQNDEQYSSLLSRQSERSYNKIRKKGKSTSACNKYLKGLKLTKFQRNEILKAWSELLEKYKELKIT